MKHAPPTAQRQTPLQIFFHIPKTAGTTLIHILARQYGDGAIYRSYGVAPHPREGEMFRARPARKVAATRVFAGHFYFGIHEHLPQPSLQYTMLRDPVERELSQYYHILRAPNSPQYQKYVSEVAPQIDMNRYMSSGFNEELDNPQTRFLAGLNGADSALPYGQCTEGLLEQAISNLQTSFVLAGITEEFDASVLMLQDLFGWRMPFYRRVNISPNRLPASEISPQVMEAIHYNTRYDRRLYAHAVLEFRARLVEQTPEFHARLAAFPEANRRYWQRRLLVPNALHAVRKPLGAARRRLMGLFSVS